MNTEIHKSLFNLKNKKSQDPNIVQYKKEIRDALVTYRTDIPRTNLMLNGKNGTPKDVVFYSFMNPKEKPAIASHEYKRLNLSWRSLRKHNQDIEVRFCYDGNDPMWASLCEEHNIRMFPFHESFTGKEPNAWCIHRWYNLALWSDEDLNVLYMDADTYFNGDIQLVFDNYRRDPVYGREELGFRHDPIWGSAAKTPASISILWMLLLWHKVERLRYRSIVLV